MTALFSTKLLLMVVCCRSLVRWFHCGPWACFVIQVSSIHMYVPVVLVAAVSGVVGCELGCELGCYYARRWECC
jgi:hypothetical protein